MLMTNAVVSSLKEWKFSTALACFEADYPDIEDSNNPVEHFNKLCIIRALSNKYGNVGIDNIARIGDDHPIRDEEVIVFAAITAIIGWNEVF